MGMDEITEGECLEQKRNLRITVFQLGVISEGGFHGNE